MKSLTFFLAAALGLAAIVLGVTSAARSQQESSNPVVLLRWEATQGPEQPVSERWSRLGPAVIPTLCQTLERKESAVGAFLRLRLNALAIRFDWPEQYRPSPGELRAAVARVLVTLGPPAEVAIPPLIRALAAETEREPRLALIFALGQMGPSASNALPQLEGFRFGADEEQIQFAREAVGKIQP